MSTSSIPYTHSVTVSRLGIWLPVLLISTLLVSCHSTPIVVRATCIINYDITKPKDIGDVSELFLALTGVGGIHISVAVANHSSLPVHLKAISAQIFTADHQLIDTCSALGFTPQPVDPNFESTFRISCGSLILKLPPAEFTEVTVTSEEETVQRTRAACTEAKVAVHPQERGKSPRFDPSFLMHVPQPEIACPDLAEYCKEFSNRVVKVGATGDYDDFRALTAATDVTVRAADAQALDAYHDIVRILYIYDYRHAVIEPERAAASCMTVCKKTSDTEALPRDLDLYLEHSEGPELLK